MRESNETDFIMEPTAKTPGMTFRQNGKFVIDGRSIPENSVRFYRPLHQWLESYINLPADETVLDVELEYFNTSSLKCLVEIMRKLEVVHGKSSEVKVNWYYEEEDEDMLESGEDFKAIVKLPIILKKK